METKAMHGSQSGTALASSQHDAATGHFQPGHTEYRAKQDRIAGRLEQLCAEYEATPAQRQILAVVARHLDEAERGKTALARTRATNAAHRLLRAIPRKQPKRPATLQEWYDGNDD